MDHSRRIAIATASRSERGLLKPIIEAAKARDDLEVHVITQVINYDDEYGMFASSIQKTLEAIKPELILVPTDRIEMVWVAAVAYYLGIPVFHFLGGSSNTGTWDDLNRRVISSYAYIIFCEDEAAKQRLIKSGEDPWRCIVTGTTHFDNMEIDLMLVPPGKQYDLVLINANPADPEDTKSTVETTLRLIDDTRLTFWIAPNEDTGRDLILAAIPDRANLTALPGVPRPQFLGLLKNCDRFLSNSSAGVYEGQHFIRPVVVNPGKRNLHRTWKHRGEYSTQVGPKIAEILATLPLGGVKLLKEYYRD